MVVDVGVVKNYIEPKADSTLYNMRKADLIEYIRTLEHNYNVAVSFNENQAKYIESLGFDKLVRCKERVGWCPEEIAKKYGVDRYCALTRIPTDADDFCSHGERRTDHV